MATILRVRDLRIVIYSNDHAPPHCHVIGPGAAAKIELGDGPVQPSVLTNRGLSRRQLATALELIVEHRDSLLRCWRDLHGTEATN